MVGRPARVGHDAANAVPFQATARIPVGFDGVNLPGRHVGFSEASDAINGPWRMFTRTRR